MQIVVEEWEWVEEGDASSFVVLVVDVIWILDAVPGCRPDVCFIVLRVESGEWFPYKCDDIEGRLYLCRLFDRVEFVLHHEPARAAAAFGE